MVTETTKFELAKQGVDTIPVKRGKGIFKATEMGNLIRPSLKTEDI